MSYVQQVKTAHEYTQKLRDVIARAFLDSYPEFAPMAEGALVTVCYCLLLSVTAPMAEGALLELDGLTRVALTPDTCRPDT